MAIVTKKILLIKCYSTLDDMSKEPTIKELLNAQLSSETSYMPTSTISNESQQPIDPFTILTPQHIPPPLKRDGQPFHRGASINYVGNLA